jgi:hypothetical protein
MLPTHQSFLSFKLYLVPTVSRSNCISSYFQKLGNSQMESSVATSLQFEIQTRINSASLFMLNRAIPPRGVDLSSLAFLRQISRSERTMMRAKRQKIMRAKRRRKTGSERELLTYLTRPVWQGASEGVIDGRRPLIGHRA